MKKSLLSLAAGLLFVTQVSAEEFTLGYATLEDGAGKSWHGASLTGLMPGSQSDFMMSTTLFSGEEGNMLWTLNSGSNWRVTDQFSLYILGGLAYLDTDNAEHSTGNLGFNFGGGMRFYLGPRLILNAGLEKSLVSNHYVSNPTSFNIGLGWAF